MSGNVVRVPGCPLNIRSACVLDEVSSLVSELDKLSISINMSVFLQFRWLANTADEVSSLHTSCSQQHETSQSLLHK